MTPVLRGLFVNMQSASVIGNAHRQPIQALGDLLEICCGPSSNIRPLCHLLTQQVGENKNSFSSSSCLELMLIFSSCVPHPSLGQLPARSCYSSSRERISTYIFPGSFPASFSICWRWSKSCWKILFGEYKFWQNNEPYPSAWTG